VKFTVSEREDVGPFFAALLAILVLGDLGFPVAKIMPNYFVVSTVWAIGI
jgi:hypothetical protein